MNMQAVPPGNIKLIIQRGHLKNIILKEVHARKIGQKMSFQIDVIISLQIQLFTVIDLLWFMNRLWCPHNTSPKIRDSRFW